MAKKVVLAYSGGLDTSVAVHWMREQWGVEVICVALNVGQSDMLEPEVLKSRAAAAGASDCLSLIHI